VKPPDILLGTCSFTANGWSGTFYPKRARPGDFLSLYAERFFTVEIDSTFYACPAAKTVTGWAEKTPDDFLFSVKAPQVITHEKVLVNCGAELDEFLRTMTLLGPKLGPTVFQFPFFSKSIFRDRQAFLDRLVPFLRGLPSDRKFAVELRNRPWIDAELSDLLRSHKIALVLQDRAFMDDPAQWNFDPVTTDWAYIRWLGDRKGIESQTLMWDKTVIDRTTELKSWVDFCERVRRRGVMIFAYANNHFGGHAPATIQLFRELWAARGLPDIPLPEPPPEKRDGLLFPL